MYYWNEHPSPPVKSRRLQALQILCRLRDYTLVNLDILTQLNLSTNDMVETLEYLFQEAIDKDELVECGSCGSYHRPDFRGDCRNNGESFPRW